MSYDYFLSKEGLKFISTFANGIGPTKTLLPPFNKTSTLIELAHSFGLQVHPYTFRSDFVDTQYFQNIDHELVFFFQLGVDGVFIDQPDVGVNVRTALYAYNPNQIIANANVTSQKELFIIPVLLTPILLCIFVSLFLFQLRKNQSKDSFLLMKEVS